MALPPVAHMGGVSGERREASSPGARGAVLESGEGQTSRRAVAPRCVGRSTAKKGVCGYPGVER